METGNAVCPVEGFSGGSSTFFGLKLKAAIAKQSSTGTTGSSLPDLNAIKVSIASPEEIVAHAEAAQQRSAYARQAAGKIVQLRARRDQLRLIATHDGILSPDEIEEIASLDSIERKILSAGDAQLQAAIRFAIVLAEIRAAEPTPENARKFLQQSMQAGRFKEATEEELRIMRSADGKFPAGTLFYAGLAYLPAHSGAPQRALETELRKFLGSVKKAEHEAAREAVNAILFEGLDGIRRNLSPFRAGVAGTYVLHFPERETKGRMSSEGVALVKLTSRSLRKGGTMPIVSVVRGAGSLAWLGEYAGKWISFASFKCRKNDPNLEGDLAEFSTRFIRTLWAAIAASRNRVA